MTKYGGFIPTQEDENITEIVTAQYCNFKFLVAGKIKAGMLQTFDIIMASYALNDEQFSKLSIMMDICATFQASSANCERGFSLMNNMKTKARNRIRVDHLDKLMQIKSYLSSGKEVSLDDAYSRWVSHRDRREKSNTETTSS